MTDLSARLAWTFQDAWLLTATGLSGRRGCSLRDLIGAADALNHDIPTETQAAVSLGRLVASDLVEVHRSRYRVTTKGQSIYEQGHGSMFELPGSVLAALRSVRCVDGKVEFAAGEFDAAYEEYARR